MPPNQNQQYQDPNRPPQQRPPYSPSPYDYILNQPMPEPKKSNKKAIILVLVLLLGVGSSAAAFYATSQQKNTPATPATNTASNDQNVAAANEWTGKANNYNWSDAKNWSKGRPQNGQSLHIDVSKVEQLTSASGSTAVLFENDITNLTVNKLTIDGKVNSIIMSIEGNPISVTGGIEDAITQTAAEGTATVPQISFHNKIAFVGDATLRTTGKNVLSFVNDSDTAIVVKKSLKINATATSQIDVSGALEGTGKLEVPDNGIAQGALVTFRYASPDFKGKVAIGTGSMVYVGNQNTTGSVNALGSGSITIADGGALRVLGTHTTGFTLNNNITMEGAGVISAVANTGDHTGAISACLTSGEQGCESNVTVTLGGKVTLTGDTQLGSSYGVGSSAIPSETTVIYSFEHPVEGGYQLIAVPASMVLIQQK